MLMYQVVECDSESDYVVFHGVTDYLEKATHLAQQLAHKAIENVEDDHDEYGVSRKEKHGKFQMVLPIKFSGNDNWDNTVAIYGVIKANFKMFANQSVKQLYQTLRVNLEDMPSHLKSTMLTNQVFYDLIENKNIEPEQFWKYCSNTNEFNLYFSSTLYKVGTVQTF
jgi:lysyl-tRNA synthetase class II